MSKFGEPPNFDAKVDEKSVRYVFSATELTVLSADYHRNQMYERCKEKKNRNGRNKRCARGAACHKLVSPMYESEQDDTCTNRYQSIQLGT